MLRFSSLTLVTLMVAAALSADGANGAAPGASPSAPSGLEARRKALNDLLAEQWDYDLSTNPEFASILGDKRWNDKSSEVSEAAVQRDLAKSREYLTRFKAIDTTGFPEQEALNKTLMVRDLERGLENAKYESWLMPAACVGLGVLLLTVLFWPIGWFARRKYRAVFPLDLVGQRPRRLLVRTSFDVDAQDAVGPCRRGAGDGAVKAGQ